MNFNFSSLPSVLYVLIPSLVTLLVGILTGGWAGYNGWQRNRLDANEQHNQASTTLVNEAMSLVTQMRDEIARLRAENQEFREKFDYLNRRVDMLEEENRRLREALDKERANNSNIIVKGTIG